MVTWWGENADNRKRWQTVSIRKSNLPKRPDLCFPSEFLSHLSLFKLVLRAYMIFGPQLRKCKGEKHQSMLRLLPILDKQTHFAPWKTSWISSIEIGTQAFPFWKVVRPKNLEFRYLPKSAIRSAFSQYSMSAVCKSTGWSFSLRDSINKIVYLTNKAKFFIGEKEKITVK